jgi:hypothetical protein
MATTTYEIDHTMVGALIDPPDGWLQSVEWIGHPPSRFDAAAMKADSSTWACSYLTLRGEGDLWNLVSFDLTNVVRRLVNLNFGYRGRLLIAALPHDTRWSVGVSDQPVTARERAAADAAIWRAALDRSLEKKKAA